MELESEDGAVIPIESGSKTEIGRGLGLGLAFGPLSSDRTVSRRHLSLDLINDPVEGFRVGFEVIGKNPVLICSKLDGGKRIYKKSEKGELGVGDRFSLSLKNPSFFVVRKKEAGEEKGILDAVERREKRTRDRRKEKEERAKSEGGGDEGELIGELGLGLDLGSLDISQIDPVLEFGFLVKGHEFDKYPKKIHAVKSWNWFLEESGEKSDDDETIDEGSSPKGKKHGRRRKRTKGGVHEDEDWTGESEEENVLAEQGVRSGKRPKYSTRSKERRKPCHDASGGRKCTLTKDDKVRDDEAEEEDEEDETLGGFIVDDENEEEEIGEEESDEELGEEEEDEDEDDYDDD